MTTSQGVEITGIHADKGSTDTATQAKHEEELARALMAPDDRCCDCGEVSPDCSGLPSLDDSYCAAVKCMFAPSKCIFWFGGVFIASIVVLLVLHASGAFDQCAKDKHRFPCQGFDNATVCCVNGDFLISDCSCECDSGWTGSKCQSAESDDNTPVT